MKKSKTSPQLKSKNTYIALAVVLLVGIVGTIILGISPAQTPIISQEAEEGVLAGCATQLDDNSASNNQAVQFTDCQDDTGGGLDQTGATIPNTNTLGQIPSGAIYMATDGSDSNSGTKASPLATLNKAIALVGSGGTVVVRGGDYHQAYTSNSGIISKKVTLMGYPGEQAWFDGTTVEPASNWTSDGAGHWYMTWSTPSFCAGGYYSYAYNAQQGSASDEGNDKGPCNHWDMANAAYTDSSNPAAGDPQMVFSDGSYIHEVTSLNTATGNNFYYQENLGGKTGKLYIGFNPSGKTVELSAWPSAFHMTTAGSKLLGVGFRRYASNEYNNNTEGGVVLGGGEDTVDGSVFAYNAGGGLGLGSTTGVVVNNSVFANNGFDGLEGNGHESGNDPARSSADNLQLVDNVFNNNNTEHFGTKCSESCSQAGVKLAHMLGFLAKGNIFENNYDALGFWCDEACTNGVAIENVAHNNGKDGLMYEISDYGIFASNLVYSNGGYGIRIASADTEVYNNTLINNGSAQIWVYDDPRYVGNTESTQIGPDTKNVSIGNNIMEGSGTMVKASGNSGGTNTNPGQANFFSAIDYNSFYRSSSSSQALYQYVSPSTTYASLGSFRSAHSKFSVHDTDTVGGGDPFFVNLTSGNYNLRTGSDAYKSGGALPADVAAALGVSTAAGQNRGALKWTGQ